MPIPIVFIAIAIGTGGLGLGKTVKAGIDTHKAKKVTTEANSLLDAAIKRLNKAKRHSGKKLEQLGKTKVEVLDSSVNHFIRSFEKIKNIDFKKSDGLTEINKLKSDKQVMKELKEMGGFATSILSGVAGGALGGALTAFGAYSAAGAFAAASTGTAIASLSGAAATNATLAFFGGGSLAAGGLGMAGGTAVLGGLVAGPALAIMGIIVGAKASKAKDEAYSNLAQAQKYAKEYDLATALCNAIASRCDMFCNILKELDSLFKPLLDSMDDTIDKYGTDFSAYPVENKQNIAAAASLVISIKAVLDTPILTQNGDLTSESAKIIRDFKTRKKRKKSVADSSRKKSPSECITIEDIVKACSYDKHYENKYSSEKKSFYNSYGKIQWGDLIEQINSNYGIKLNKSDFRAYIKENEKGESVGLYDVASGLSRFVLLYQLGYIVQMYSSNDMLNSTIINLSDVDWDGAVDKINEIYGVKMEVWQLTSAKQSDGTINPKSIVEQVYLKLLGQPDDNQKYLLSADKFLAIIG